MQTASTHLDHQQYHQYIIQRAELTPGAANNKAAAAPAAKVQQHQMWIILQSQ